MRGQTQAQGRSSEEAKVKGKKTQVSVKLGVRGILNPWSRAQKQPVVFGLSERRGCVTSRFPDRGGVRLDFGSGSRRARGVCGSEPSAPAADRVLGTAGTWSSISEIHAL